MSSRKRLTSRSVAEASGEEHEFLGLGRRNGQIAGVAADDPQGVDQVALKDVGFAEAGGVFGGDQAAVFEGRQGVERVDGAERRVEMAVRDLQALDEILGSRRVGPG